MARVDLAATEARLRDLVLAHRGEFAVTDGPRGLALELPEAVGQPWGYVAGVRGGARYVSVYLMCAYADPSLLDDASPALRARRQGRSCFNFTHVDEALFAELDALVRRGVAGHRAAVGAALAARSTRLRDDRHRRGGASAPDARH